MTKPYAIDCEKGASCIVFADDGDHAAEIFVCWRAAKGYDPVSFSVGLWYAELNAKEQRHLRDAIDSRIVGIGSYNEFLGWSVEAPGS